MTGIYYADLFVINGKGCVVMGCGKSQTCRSYTGETTKEVMTDSLRFDVEGRAEFKDLLADRDLKFISVPWGDSMETKGAMIKAYVK